MASSVVHPERIRVRRDVEPRSGRHVLYWMQRAQRAEDNDALEHAIRLANGLELPVLVVFGLTADYPDASTRHFTFMLEGLQETRDALARRDIGFVAREGHPPDVCVAAAEGAAVLVMDTAYLPHLRAWRDDVLDALDDAGSSNPLRVEQVEADVCVPPHLVSDERQYAARTIRPRIHDHLDDLLEELTTTAVNTGRAALHAAATDGGLDLGDGAADIAALLDRLDVDDEVPATDRLHGGTSRGKAQLRAFLDDDLDGYSERKPDPVAIRSSMLSPYLHYGQVSPVWAALQARAAGPDGDEDVEGFVEELVVRRELSVNFCLHVAADELDSLTTLPDWARTTLEDHADDERSFVYTADELEAGRTHDVAWNACMAEMRETGYLHNHLRMYWGKQLMRWTNTPQYALRTLLDLNNRYFLDGRDCASYANVLWCFGLHDQAWQEREVVGKTRFMNYNGLKRKIDVAAYVDHVRDDLGLEVHDPGPDDDDRLGPSS